MRYLLDTCVISERFRSKPSGKVLAWLDAADDRAVFLSVLTLGEIAQGIAKLGHSVKADSLSRWLREDIEPLFHDRLVGIDRNVAIRWGEVRGSAMAQGRVPAVIDSLIAATALAHDMSVITRNVTDFESMGVTVVNPWQA